MLFQFEPGGPKLAVHSTHAPPKSGRTSQDSEITQVVAHFATLNRLRQRFPKSIFAGDFNADPAENSNSRTILFNSWVAQGLRTATANDASYEGWRDTCRKVYDHVV